MSRISPPPTRRDSKTDLLEAARAVVKDRQDRATHDSAARMQPAVRNRVSVLALLSLVGVLLLLLRPDWLAGPKGLPVETPVVAEASLRLAMLRERQRVEDFLKQYGRLPASLEEAGGAVPGIGYEPAEGRTFRIFAQTGDSLLVLRSGDSMSLFLGNSLREIKNRGRP